MKNEFGVKTEKKFYEVDFSRVGWKESQRDFKHFESLESAREWIKVEVERLEKTNAKLRDIRLSLVEIHTERFPLPLEEGVQNGNTDNETNG